MEQQQISVSPRDWQKYLRRASRIKPTQRPSLIEGYDYGQRQRKTLPGMKFFHARVQRPQICARKRSMYAKLPGINFDRMLERPSMKQQQNCLSERHFNNFKFGTVGHSPSFSRKQPRTKQLSQTLDLQYEVGPIIDKFRFDRSKLCCLTRFGDNNI